MNISGTIRIYKNQFEDRETYSTTISKKDQFGNYENLYISLHLPQGTNLENNSRINVTKGFLSFYKTRQGLPKIKAVIQEFEAEDPAQQPMGTPTSNYEQQAQNYFDNPANYYGDDLPF